jgi:polyhydroxybutyrate depolymerase
VIPPVGPRFPPRLAALALVVAFAGGACGDGDQAASASAPTTVAAGGVPLVVTGPGRYEAEVPSGDGARRFVLVVPASAPEPAPLVLVFHGFTRNPEEIERTTGMSALAEQEGFVVAYPAGSGFPTRWRSGAWQGSGDVDLARDLVALVSGAVPIDPARVYAAGFSNGGGMAARLACDAADVFAAVGPVAAAYPGGECDPVRPVPVVAVHGTADAVVPYDGRGEALPAVEGVVSAWVERNGCDPEPAAGAITGDVVRVWWGGCAQGADVVLYRVEDGRHGWPGSGDGTPWGRTTDSVDASALIWEFFAAHPMP